MSKERFVLNKCEDCPYIEVEEYTPNVGFPFVKVFLHCTKTDLYVLSSSKREFLKWDTGIRSD